ncbi:hypothetical protein [Christensenella tenuis]|uniref:DUF5050 domain-containing protein n=1 Tax=Christensenella tenuis TaxID=2763033 RepID=A0ABR7ECD0_9FIRM|nr:hypothetical protein [Christensenella tenuis]MBC5646843.1 hypothetical protein [Christensenella tenuis]
MKKRILCIFMAVIAALFSLNACAAVGEPTEEGTRPYEEGNGKTSEETAVNTDSGYTGEGLPDYLSGQQKAEITALYNEAYEDEAKGIDSYISDYILLRTGRSEESYDPYAEILESLVGTTESLYQAVNEFDPGIKHELTALTEQKYGYIAGKGVQYLLSNSELGQSLREVGEITVLALTDIMLNWTADDSPQVTKYALMPCSVNGNYVLMRTYGSLAEMVNEAAMPYSLAENAVEERYDALNEALLPTASEDFDLQMNADPDDPEEVEAVFEMLRRTEPVCARLSVLDAKREALQKDERNVIDGFLSGKGITDYSMEEEDSNYYQTLPSMQQCIYYIMDSEGNIYWSFTAEKELNATIGEDGTCAMWHSDFEPADENHIIVDKNGNVLYRNEIITDTRGEIEAGSVIYYNISPSGNVLRQTFRSDFEHGDYSTVELVTPEGKTIPVKDELDYFEVVGVQEGYDRATEFLDLTDYDFTGGVSAYSDTVCIAYNIYSDGQVVLDMKTGKQTPAREIKDKEMETVAEVQEKYGFDFTLVGDQYILNMADYVLYDRAGNMAADFQDGEGPKDSYPYYEDGAYWVVTNTGYFYVTNETFEKILEPVKLCEDAETKFYPGYGLCVFDPNEKTMTLYNKNGGKEITLYKDTASENWGTGSDGWDELSTGFICGNERTGWYNMKKDTADIMLIPDYNGEITDMSVEA